MRHYGLYIFLFFFQTLNAQNVSSKNGIYFIDSISKYKTIDEILSLPQFINKIVYIDLWAPTCIPCIKEFSFIEEVQKSFVNKNVAFMYICYNGKGSAKDQWWKKWMDMVDQYNLKGTNIYTHLMPPNILIHDVVDMAYIQKNPINLFYGIPTYFIAKHGKLVVIDAYRPSQINLLTKQIDSVSRLPSIL